MSFITWLGKAVCYLVARGGGIAAGHAAEQKFDTALGAAVQSRLIAALPAITQTIDDAVAQLEKQIDDKIDVEAASVHPILTAAMQTLNLGANIESQIDSAIYTVAVPGVESLTKMQLYSYAQAIVSAVQNAAGVTQVTQGTAATG